MTSFLMVKPMQHSLSRIEREYVVQHLAEVLPALVLLSGNDFTNITAASYMCTHETIDLHGLNFRSSELFDVRVFFRHEKRGMYFDSQVKIDLKGSGDIPISPKIFLNDAPPAFKSDCTLILEDSGKAYSISTEDRYPLDSYFIDPEIYSSHHTSMKKLADRIGFDTSENNYSVAHYRLFEYLDGIRSDKTNQKIDGSLFYIDNKTVLLSLPENIFTSKRRDAEISVSFRCGKRTVKFNAGIKGFLPVNKMLRIVCLHIIDAQEEDKRFLYERLFKVKYLG